MKEGDCRVVSYHWGRHYVPVLLPKVIISGNLFESFKGGKKKEGRVAHRYRVVVVLPSEKGEVGYLDSVVETTSSNLPFRVSSSLMTYQILLYCDCL